MNNLWIRLMELKKLIWGTIIIRWIFHKSVIQFQIAIIVRFQTVYGKIKNAKIKHNNHILTSKVFSQMQKNALMI